MERYFNTEGFCNPQEHYMVDLDSRLAFVKTTLVDRKRYFVIHKGRQYGKTTMMKALAKYLGKDYLVLSVDFQKLSASDFKNEHIFVHSFTGLLLMAAQRTGFVEKGRWMLPLRSIVEDGVKTGLMELFMHLSRLCMDSPRPVVLMIDEVDSAGNYQVFLDFLAQLRSGYLERGDVPAFHSVILAGVYDIKNLKLKLRPDAQHQYNSPWNIAASFKVDMDFSAGEIAKMLAEYEKDHHTGMDIVHVSEEIYQYTSGYPVLVSALCKYMDEEPKGEAGFAGGSRIWTRAGVLQAVKAVLAESAPLFESMVRHLDDFPQMKRMVQAILFQGSEFAYNPDLKEVNLACMFGYAAERAGKVQIANRIFEMRLYNYFLSEEELSCAIGDMAKRDKNCFVHDGMLDMDMVMKKFVEYFIEIYGGENMRFVEKCGRKRNTEAGKVPPPQRYAAQRLRGHKIFPAP